jgi:hypothetical protein
MLIFSKQSSAIAEWALAQRCTMCSEMSEYIIYQSSIKGLTRYFLIERYKQFISKGKNQPLIWLSLHKEIYLAISKDRNKAIFKTYQSGRYTLKGLGRTFCSTLLNH